MIEQVKGTQNIAGEDSLKYLYIQNQFLNKFGDHGYKYLQTPLIDLSNNSLYSSSGI